jgi:hypothetical protein
MILNNTFHRVETLADDAITVRISTLGDKLGATIDFPTFQHGNGKIYRANTSRHLSVTDALLTAIAVLPQTPFGYVAVILDEQVVWQEDWGRLV